MFNKLKQLLQTILRWQYLIQTIQSISLFCDWFRLCPLPNGGKWKTGFYILYFSIFCYYSTTTLYRELIGIVDLLTIYERNIIGSDHFNNVFIDQKKFSAEKGNPFSTFHSAKMQVIKHQKLRIIYTKGKNLSVGDMLGCFFTPRKNYN